MNSLTLHADPSLSPQRQTCKACNGEAVTRGNCRCEVCDGRGWVPAESRIEESETLYVTPLEDLRKKRGDGIPLDNGVPVDQS